MKGKVKAFVKRHKIVIEACVVGCMISGAYILGFKDGHDKTVTAYDLGLGMMWCTNPDLKPIMQETIEKTKEILNS